eukprot:457900-Prymnesium_polylepis.2
MAREGRWPKHPRVAGVTRPLPATGRGTHHHTPLAVAPGGGGRRLTDLRALRPLDTRTKSLHNASPSRCPLGSSALRVHSARRCACGHDR